MRAGLAPWVTDPRVIARLPHGCTSQGRRPGPSNMPCPALRRVGLKHATGELRANVGDRDLQPIEKGALVMSRSILVLLADRSPSPVTKNLGLLGLRHIGRTPYVGGRAHLSSVKKPAPRRLRAGLLPRAHVELAPGSCQHLHRSRDARPIDGAAEAQSQTLSGPRCSPAQRPATRAYIPSGSRRSLVDSPTGRRRRLARSSSWLGDGMVPWLLGFGNSLGGWVVTTGSVVRVRRGRGRGIGGWWVGRACGTSR